MAVTQAMARVGRLLDREEGEQLRAGRSAPASLASAASAVIASPSRSCGMEGVEA